MIPCWFGKTYEWGYQQKQFIPTIPKHQAVALVDFGPVASTTGSSPLFCRDEAVDGERRAICGGTSHARAPCWVPRRKGRPGKLEISRNCKNRRDMLDSSAMISGMWCDASMSPKMTPVAGWFFLLSFFVETILFKWMIPGGFPPCPKRISTSEVHPISIPWRIRMWMVDWC